MEEKLHPTKAAVAVLDLERYWPDPFTNVEDKGQYEYEEECWKPRPYNYEIAQPRTYDDPEVIVFSELFTE